VTGFRSSDCRTFAAHLIALPHDAGMALGERPDGLDGHWFTPHSLAAGWERE
jgi:hypothetical protein